MSPLVASLGPMALILGTPAAANTWGSGTPTAASHGPARAAATTRSLLAGLRQGRLDHAALPSFLRRRGGVRRTTPAAGPGVRVLKGAKVALREMRACPSSSAAFYERREMPTDAASLSRLIQDARLASFPYARRAEALPEGWTTREDLAGSMRQALGLKSAGVEHGHGVIVDRGSGLTAVLLQRPESQELVVAFGGTSAGKKVGETIGARVKPGRNFRSTLSQWGANLFAGLGGTPRSYQQAATLVRALQQHVEADPALAGLRLRAVGHSKGAGEAMFASLGARTPVPVTAFCPAHLSEGLIKQLPAGNLAQAKQLVASFSPYGDPVAAMRGKLPRMPGVGAGYHFDGIPKQGAMHRHDRFHEHVAHWCAHAQAAMAR